MLLTFLPINRKVLRKVSYIKYKERGLFEHLGALFYHRNIMYKILGLKYQKFHILLYTTILEIIPC